MTTSITCRELIEFLDDYVADRLTPDTKATFDRHLGICPACRDFLKSYRDTMTLARGAMASPSDDAAPAVPEDVVQAILATRTRM
jgi:anti-sigma factor RsiW